jgi:hypothetical protein
MKARSKSPAPKSGEARWWRHPNRLPDGTISSHSFRVAWYEDGRRVRRNVATEDEARDLVSTHMKHQLESAHGVRTQVTWMSKSQVAAAESAFRLLERAGKYDARQSAAAAVLETAAEYYVATYSETTAILKTARQAVDAFLTARSPSVSARTLRSHRGYLDEFCRGHGDQLIAAITPRIIQNYLDSLEVGNVAKLHRWDSLHAVFEFARGKKNVDGAWVETNPVKSVPEPAYNPSVAEIYSLAECKRLIEAAITHGYAATIITRLFTMIRAEEMEKMVQQGGTLWAYADPKLGWVALPGTVVKTKADKKRKGRKIRILPVLEEWLQVFRRKHWDIQCDRTKDDAVRQYANPAKLGRGSGYSNLIRHTAVSHRVTKEGSFATVADEAGTSEVVIRTNYYRRTDDKETKAFFSLGPKKFRTLIKQAAAGRRGATSPATTPAPLDQS